MLQKTWKRLGSAAWLAVGLVILVPALAEAQLFPNRTIRREKPDCATEPPFYKQVRRDYFGYYPTCWSRFPAGWGCPCPDTELQMMRAEFNDTKKPTLNSKPRSGDERYGAGADAGMDETNPDGGTRPVEPKPDLPAPPTNRSPFEMDNKPSTPAPTPAPPSPGPGVSSRPANPGTALPASSPSVLELPSLPATSPSTSNESAARPGSMSLYPDDAVLTSNNSSLRPDLGPLPTAPTPAPFTPENAGTPMVVATAPAETVLGTPAPAQAPKRRSILAQLFGRNNSSTTNR